MVIRPLPPPGTARPFVGRARELAIAADCLAKLMAGRGGVLLVAGEPGIGKTSLAEQASGKAADLGVPVAWGRCPEDDGAPPLWPWRQILSVCLSRPAAGELGAGLPDLGYLVPGMARRGRDAAAPPPDGSDRFRLFESVTAVVAAAAEPGGLVVVLDDLHWADPLSARLLAHVGRGLAASRVLAVVTYRDHAMSSNADLSGAIAALVRESGTVQLRLGGLAEAEVADQL
jgi:predicted ATPase